MHRYVVLNKQQFGTALQFQVRQEITKYYMQFPYCQTMHYYYYYYYYYY